MKCPDTSFPRRTCTCSECESLRDAAAELRLRKAHVLLAERDERQREQELSHLDKHLREIAKELA